MCNRREDQPTYVDHWLKAAQIEFAMVGSYIGIYAVSPAITHHQEYANIDFKATRFSNLVFASKPQASLV